MNINKETLFTAVMTIIAMPSFALGKDLPVTKAQEPARGATLEMVDQGKSIELKCETFTFEARALSESEDPQNADAQYADCATLVDANTPLLLDYLRKKQRLEKAVLSVKPAKGHAYTLELVNPAITYVSISDSNVSLNLSVAKTRLTLEPR